MLDTLGFQHVQSNNSIYIYSKRDVKIIVPVFIDDITLVLKDNSVMTFTVQELQQYFKLYNLGPNFFLLSVQIKQDLETYTISLSQSHYINKLLKHFEMDDCNLVKIPLSLEIDLSSLVPTPSEQTEMKSVLYLLTVDSLQYLATIT